MRPAESSLSILAVKAGGRIVAVPVAHVVEVMRSQPIESLAGAPPFVRGLAVIRGNPVPVVDLDALLTGSAPASADASPSARFVSLRIGNRRVALLVEAVLSFRNLAIDELNALPPLWSGTTSPAVCALTALDRDLLFVLEATKLLPADWPRAAEAEGRAG